MSGGLSLESRGMNITDIWEEHTSMAEQNTEENYKYNSDFWVNNQTRCSFLYNFNLHCSNID